MTLEKQEFLSRYTALMLEYAQSFEEAPLLAIEGLGHEMVQSNIPPEDIGEMHDAAIRALMETSEFSAETVRAASLPLMQLLMAYGIAFREVRARHEIEQELIESQKLYQSVVEQVSDGIVIVQDGKNAYVNNAVANIWGRPAEDIIGMDYLALIHPDEHERMAKIHQQRLAGGGPVAPYEVRCINVNGDILWVEMTGSFIAYQNRPAALVSVRDITDRKQAEDALKETQSRYAEAQDIAHLGHWLRDLEKKDLIWSNETYRIFGLDPKKCSASYHEFFNIVHPDDREAVKRAYENAVKNKTPYSIEHRLLMKDGSIKWVHERCKTVYDEAGKALRSIGTVLDITRQKASDLALKNAYKAIETSNQSLRSLIEIAQVGIVVLSNGKIILVNAYMLQRMEMDSQDALQGESYAQFLHPDDRVGSLRRTMQVLKDGVDYTNMPVRAISASGECFDFEVSSTKIAYDGADAVLSVAIDMTEKNKDTESILKLSCALEQAGESIMITDKMGVIEYVNAAFTTITGYTAQEALGATPRLLKSGNQAASFYKDMWKTIVHGHVWHGKVIDKRKDGSFFPAMLTISPIVNEHGKITHFVGIHSDLTELDSLEQQFHQAQKMEAVGTMVGGIAHNFNNMLAGMTGNLYLAKQRVQEQPYVVERLTNIEELSRHAAAMIQQLLAFARKGMVSIKEMPMAVFINETLKLLRAAVPENIAVHQHICADDLQIKGDATQLHQVLANLVNNARDALDGAHAPCITIRLEPFQTDDDFMEQHPYFEANQAYAHLSVADNGTGISKRHIKNLFEPFFTTKEQGKGTGLGLSMVYGAIKTHHGYVEVESKKGEGATFHVYIPLLNKVEEATDSMHALETVKGQGELVLLVDDDQIMSEVMAEVLESMGYRTIMAVDGLEAFAIFKARQQDISIALLDVIMPHMGGAQLAEQIREISPDLPVIFMTGYDGGAVLAKDARIQNSKIFAKPVNFDDLSHSIRQMLD